MIGFYLCLLLSVLLPGRAVTQAFSHQTQDVTNADTKSLYAALAASTAGSTINCHGTVFISASSALWPSTVVLSNSVTLKGCTLWFRDAAAAIRLQGGSTLTLQDMNVVMDAPQSASMTSVLTGVDVTSAGASLALTNVLIYTDVTSLRLSDAWSSIISQAVIIDAVSDAVVNVTQSNCKRACRVASFAGVQSLQLAGVTVLDSTRGCFQGGSIAYDSATLKAGLSRGARSILVGQDILLSHLDFQFAAPLVIVNHSMVVYGCSMEQLDLNYDHTRAGISLREGGRLTLHALSIMNAHIMPRLFWPTKLAPLISLFTVYAGGGLTAQNCSIASPMPSQLQQLLDLPVLKSAGPGLAPDYEWMGNDTMQAVFIRSWRMDRRLWPLILPTPAVINPADAFWQFTNVTVTTSGFSCWDLNEGSPGIRVDSGAKLKELLADDLIKRMEIAADITFIKSEWPKESSSPLQGQLSIRRTRSLKIRACHPVAGQRYNIDFGNLGQVVFVFGNLTWKGDMHMVTTHGSPRRAWLYPLVAALSVEDDGVIAFEVRT